MRKTFSIVTTAGAALLAGNLAMMPVAVAGDSLPTDKECGKLEKADAATKGWCTMINRKKGNCLACHDVVTMKMACRSASIWQYWPTTGQHEGTLPR